MNSATGYDNHDSLAVKIILKTEILITIGTFHRRQLSKWNITIVNWYIISSIYV